MATRPRLHALSWLVWALSATVCVLVARSAVYGALILLIAVLCVEVHGLATPIGRAFPLFCALAAIFAGMRVVLDALTGHVAGNHTWFTVPSFELPAFLGGLEIGGPVQREVVLASAADAFVVVVIIAVFGAWNAVVSHHELTQSIPRAFHELGLVITVAFAFIPSTIEAVRRTREADRARAGGSVPRGRLRRTVFPVLQSGLERAIALSEAMDSRGFGHRHAVDARERAAAYSMVAALVALGGAGAALASRATTVATILTLVAAIAVGVGVAASTAAARRTRYRPRPFRALDVAVTAAVALAPAALGIVAAVTDAPLVWIPRELELPGFDLGVAVAISLLAVPTLVPPRRSLPA
jgi:energy-coupling factor transport system permease protein